MLSEELVYLNPKSEEMKRRLFAMPYFEETSHGISSTDKLIRTFNTYVSAESLFFGFTVKRQEAIFNSLLSSYPWRAQQFLQSVNILDSDAVQFPSRAFDVYKFAEHLSQFSENDQPLTEEFNRSLLGSTDYDSDRVSKMTILLILRDRVGEYPLLEIFDLFQKNDVQPFDYDLVDLCKNWGEYRDKPFEWICEIVSDHSAGKRSRV